jgi:hypothetical protein
MEIETRRSKVFNQMEQFKTSECIGIEETMQPLFGVEEYFNQKNLNPP